MIHDYNSMNTTVLTMVTRRDMEEDFLSTRKAPSLYDPTPIHASRVNVVAKVKLTDSVWLEDDEERWLIMSLLKRRVPHVISGMEKKRRISDCSVVVSAEFESLANEDEELSSSSEVACSTSSETSCCETKFRKFQSEQWLVRYNDLIEFRARHGHCLVAKCQDADLAKWVKR
jgi:Helicase associated domain